MSAIRRNLDGQTGRYTVVDGDYLDDGTSQRSKVVLAMRTRKGSAAADPELGSLFHTIKTTSGADHARAVMYGKACLARLILQKQIADVRIEIDLNPEVPGRMDVLAHFTNLAGNTDTVRATTGT